MIQDILIYACKNTYGNYISIALASIYPDDGSSWTELPFAMLLPATTSGVNDVGWGQDSS